MADFTLTGEQKKDYEALGVFLRGLARGGLIPEDVDHVMTARFRIRGDTAYVAEMTCVRGDRAAAIEPGASVVEQVLRACADAIETLEDVDRMEPTATGGSGVVEAAARLREAMASLSRATSVPIP